MATIKIACEGAGKCNFKEIIPFQGKLKQLTDINYERLKHEILTSGFNSPIHVWKKSNKLYNIDGHQRIAVLTKLEGEGYTIPEIPIDYIKAKSYQNAKHILLSRVSEYGEITERGLVDFVNDAQIGIDEMKVSFNFPNIDFDSFEHLFISPKADTNADYIEDFSKQAKEFTNENGMPLKKQRWWLFIEFPSEEMFLGVKEHIKHVSNNKEIPLDKFLKAIGYEEN